MSKVHLRNERRSFSSSYTNIRYHYSHCGLTSREVFMIGEDDQPRQTVTCKRCLAIAAKANEAACERAEAECICEDTDSFCPIHNGTGCEADDISE